MANEQYLRANALQREASARQRRALMLGAAGGGILGAAFMVLDATNILGAAILVLGGMAFAHSLVERSPRHRALVSGAAGERIVEDALRELPSHFVVFNRLRLPNRMSRTGNTEIDFVVIGKGAVYTIESKNNAGTIYVAENRRGWAVRRGSLLRTMRNPIRQARYQALTVQEQLKEARVRSPIYPIVIFTNTDADLVMDGPPSVPIFTDPNTLTKFLTRFDAGLEERAQHDVIEALRVQDEKVQEALQRRAG